MTQRCRGPSLAWTGQTAKPKANNLMMGKVFFDSDVLLNAHSKQSNKITRACKDCVRQAWKNRSGVVSTTILRDFYYGLRHGDSMVLGAADARQCIEDYLSWHVIVDDVMTLVDAISMDEQLSVPINAGLVLQAALTGGATTVYSYRVPKDIGDVPVMVVRPQ